MIRYATLMADARAEYARDFRALSTRLERKTRGHAGAHYRRVLDYDPWCRVCGRPTKAKGLCGGCYVNDWKRRARRARGLRHHLTNTACGHQDRPHHASGQCHACYRRTRRRLGLRGPQKRRPVCGHPTRPHHAHGQCYACYRRTLRALQQKAS